MAEVKILYKTDHNHSYNSQEMIGVFTNKVLFEKAISKIIREQLKNVEEDDQESESDTWHIGFFLDKKQTQGLPEFELVFEEYEINQIL